MNSKMGHQAKVLFLILFTSFICLGHTQEELFDFKLSSSFVNKDIDKGNSTSIIPDILNKTCSMLSDTNKTYVFSCRIIQSNSTLFNFDQIRKWIASSEYQFMFHIKCMDNAAIVLQWPFKAKNIKELVVDNCNIAGFFMDYDNPDIETIPDNLEILDIHDSKIIVGFEDLFSFITNVSSVSVEYHCGNEETLKSYTYRNISYELTFPLEMLNNENTDPYVDEVENSGGDMISNSNSWEFKCKYKKLEYVDESISGNKSKFFASIATETSTFPRLTMFNLSNTELKHIPAQFSTWWRFFPKLKMLDLSHNSISNIDLDTSSKTWKTENLIVDLRYNNITELSSHDLELMASVPNVYFNFRHNPVDCACSVSFLEILELIKDNEKWRSLELERYDYIKHLRCETPHNLKGIELVHLETSDLSCPDLTSSLSIAPIVILSVAIVILLIVIIVLTKFRKEIYILTYTRFHIILPCQPAEMSGNKKYDAFVSYSNHDEEWVSKTFKDLEVASKIADSFFQFKFCLHHRDFVPGKTIFDNVIDSVESSRHTVIILSRHFLQSHYCMYEFHEAFQQSIIERKRHMIVVLMENIPEGELPTDLKRCLKTFTYIRRDDSIFADRLIYAMSHKPRVKSKSRQNTICDVHDNLGFVAEKNQTPTVMPLKPKSERVVNLSQIVPDLVHGHYDGNVFA